MSRSMEEIPDFSPNAWAASGTPPQKTPGDGRAGDDSAAILRLLHRHDPKGLELLAERFGRSLTRVAAVQLGNEHDAADVAQDTLLAAWDAASRPHDPARLRSWLFAILINRCRRHRRSVWRALRRVLHYRQIARPNEPPPADDRLGRLRGALARLPERQRALIALRFEQQLTVAETAQVLGVPEGTVKSRTHAAMQQLRRWMKDETL